MSGGAGMFTSKQQGVPPLAVFIEAAGRVMRKLFALELTASGDVSAEAEESIVARVPLAPAGLTMMELRMPRAAAERLVELWTGGPADRELAGDAVRELAETIAAVGYGKPGGVTRCARLSDATSAVGAPGSAGMACVSEAGPMWLGIGGGGA